MGWDGMVTSPSSCCRTLNALQLGRSYRKSTAVSFPGYVLCENNDDGGTEEFPPTVDNTLFYSSRARVCSASISSASRGDWLIEVRPRYR
jgi:hypothetical protein